MDKTEVIMQKFAALPEGSAAAVVTSPPFLGAHSGLATDEEPRQRMTDGRLCLSRSDN